MTPTTTLFFLELLKFIIFLTSIHKMIIFRKAVTMFLIIFIIFIAVFTILLRRLSSRDQKIQDEFWDRELHSNTVRKKDISSLSYITIPLDTFPIGKYKDDELSASEAALTELSGKQIVNLNGISNTDLKLNYGVPNFQFLSECDENFAVLAKTLVTYGNRLFALGHLEDAAAVLWFGITCRSDIVSNYTLLADIYRALGEEDKIASLTDCANALDLDRKDIILKKLALAETKEPSDPL